jgi:sporulation protein YlmC with PRC-barrel domain
MKTSLLFGTAFAILGTATTSMFAQTQVTTSASSASYVQTSKLIGTKVKASQGEDIGVIKDVVLDRNTGCMAYTVLSASGGGTRAGGQAKTVAVPWTVYSPSSDPSILMLRVERDRIYNAPEFDYARIDEYGTTGYINNIYTYYGVSPQAGVGVSGGVSGTATTGTATTTGATGAATGAASPAAPASPGATSPPTGTASPRAIASPRATSSPRGAASPRATASPRETYSPTGAASPGTTASPGAGAERTVSPGATEAPTSPGATRGRTRASATPSSPRGQTETASPSETGESPSETKTSPTEGKKSSRHHRTEGSSTTKPSATPQSPEEQE